MQTIIFGGAFDPPHLEHKRICKEAIEEIGADRLVLVPTFLPPHKSKANIDFDTRVQMLNAMFEDFPYTYEISTFEKDSGLECNYAVDMLENLTKKYVNSYYLIGGDSLLDFDKWRDPDKILNTLPILVAGRKGSDLAYKADDLTEKFGGKIRLLETVGEDVSSTMAKTNLYLGDNSEIDDKVLEIIKEKHMFDKYRNVVEEIELRQTPELFNHSKAVVRRAVDLNSKHKLGLDFDKVFLAALLHDNSKQLIERYNAKYEIPKDAIGTPVLHQFLGAERAKYELGIDDEEVIYAIKYHTTAKADMTTFEKLIYCADMLSDDREYEGLDELVKLIYEDFEQGFLACLERSYRLVLAKNKGMYHLTEEAYQYYIVNKNK